MAEAAPLDIPKRALFKAAEVCELIQVQPYVLRTWEAEFPELGVSKSAGSPRIYRRVDVERVARIKHLLLVEGLTLAGVRRKLDEESGPLAEDDPEVAELISQNARERLTAVKHGLRSILDLLGGNGGGEAHAARAVRRGKAVPTKRAKPVRGKPAVGRRKK